MIILEGIMHRKVKWWITFIIITVLVGIAAFAIVAKAANSWMLGGEVIKHVPACSAATGVAAQTGPIGIITGQTTPGCPGVPCPCQRCGCMWAPCVPPPPKWSETLIRPIGAATMRYSCPPVKYKYAGSIQVPAPKTHILGFGMSAFAPFITGLGR